MLLFIALLAGLNFLNAGNNPGVPAANPAYLIQLDKSFYVNGEVIWYKLLLPATPTHQGAAVKAVLSDRDGKTLFYTFLKNKRAPFVSGYYKIPFDLPGGMYRLSFLASEAITGQVFTLAYADLPIYNDGEKVVSDKVRSDSGPKNTPAVLETAGDVLKVSINLNANTIRSRDQVLAGIRVTDANGQPVTASVSIAVNDHSLITVGGGQPTLIPGLAAPIAYQLDTSITFKGRLTDYQNQPLTANVLGVLTPQQNRIHYTRTQSPGQINLRLPDFYAQQPIQFLGFPQEEENIKVSLLPDEGLAAKGDLVYTPEIMHYLELSRQRKKIFQLYKDLEFNLQPSVPMVNVQELKPERTVNVKDYESFENVYLFFKEILTPLVFRQEKGEDKVEAKIFTDLGNRVYDMLPGQPLFIIDGKATRDGNYVAHMKMDQVETVSIFTDRAELRQQFNVMGRSGVAIIETSSTDITVPETDADDIFLVRGLQAPAAFPAFTPNQIENDRHRPFFRPQLYWAPDVRTDASGQANVNFFQSDDTGDFQIRVLVQDERGRMGYAEAVYQAVW